MERSRSALANAVRLAEDFANGLPCTTLESVVREADACRDVARGDFARHSAIGAAVLAAHAAAAALRALDLRGEPAPIPAQAEADVFDSTTIDEVEKHPRIERSAAPESGGTARMPADLLPSAADGAPEDPPRQRPYPAAWEFYPLSASPT